MVWIDLILFFVLFALFVYIFVSVNITNLHKVYLAFHFTMMIWPFCQFAVKTTDNSTYQLFYVKAAFVDSALLSTGWIFFTILLTGQTRFLRRRTMLLLSVPAVLASAGVIANPHSWFVQPVNGGYIQRTYGPFFWLFITVVIIQVIISLYVISAALTQNLVPRVRTQVMLVLKGILTVTAFILLDILLNVVLDRYLPVIPGMTSLGILLSASFFVVSINRDKVFDIVTIAHQDVMDTIGHGILVLDEHDNVVEINRFLSPYMHLHRGEPFDIGIIFPEGTPGVESFIQAYREHPLERSEIEIFHTFIQRYLNIQAAPIMISGSRVGRIVTFQDITELQRLIHETNHQNKILQERNHSLIEVQKELFETNRQLQQMAVTDSLTGCYNRHYLTQHLEDEVIQNREAHISFALILLDIDFFKTVNDTYGHLAGDEVICQTVEVLKQELRPTDVLARYGGEEFIVYMPDTRESEALRLAEHVKTQVEWNQIAIANTAGPVSVTISMGLLTINDFSRKTSLFEEVDQALYQAKHKGRNRIVHIAR
ncbi:diguanylate cyclase [Paenibacillus sp. S150]|uniref:histidine kinase N-terminal 7TM domain-containing diguanylate cyclase n=1 Tax=Paenibacillus sp. S150 TaxID=2749826 RepID=UPI002816940F|nr:diguanylate cyclase [Paenibacillus sp. S150]